MCRSICMRRRGWRAPPGWEMFWRITFPMLTPVLLLNTVYTLIDGFTDYTNATVKIIVDYTKNLAPVPRGRAGHGVLPDRVCYRHAGVCRDEPQNLLHGKVRGYCAEFHG